VIPRLRSIVEQFNSVGSSRARQDDAFERLSLKLGSCNQFVDPGNVSLVMLAVMEAQGVR
jgi:hypothetical protein